MYDLSLRAVAEGAADERVEARSDDVERSNVTYVASSAHLERRVADVAKVSGTYRRDRCWQCSQPADGDVADAAPAESRKRAEGGSGV